MLDNEAKVFKIFFLCIMLPQNFEFTTTCIIFFIIWKDFIYKKKTKNTCPIGQVPSNIHSSEFFFYWYRTSGQVLMVVSHYNPPAESAIVVSQYVMIWISFGSSIHLFHWYFGKQLSKNTEVHNLPNANLNWRVRYS
jgi:hypothetical protein